MFNSTHDTHFQQTTTSHAIMSASKSFGVSFPSLFTLLLTVPLTSNHHHPFWFPSIVFVTGNANKLREVQQILAVGDSGIQVTNQALDGESRRSENLPSEARRRRRLRAGRERGVGRPRISVSCLSSEEKAPQASSSQDSSRSRCMAADSQCLLSFRDRCMTAKPRCLFRARRMQREMPLSRANIFPRTAYANRVSSPSSSARARALVPFLAFLLC